MAAYLAESIADVETVAAAPAVEVEKTVARLTVAPVSGIDVAAATAVDFVEIASAVVAFVVETEMTLNAETAAAAAAAAVVTAEQLACVCYDWKPRIPPEQPVPHWFHSPRLRPRPSSWAF